MRFGGGGKTMNKDKSYGVYTKKQSERYDDVLGCTTPFGAYKTDLIADKIFTVSKMANKEVLEVAGGTGELALRYAKESKKVVLSDFSINMLSIAKRKLYNCKNTELVATDALNLPFKDDTFNIVIERAVSLLLYDKFLEDGTAQKVLEEMKRDSNDKVIIIHGNKYPHMLLKPKRDPYHYFTGKELKKMLEDVGLDSVKTVYVTHSVPLLFNLFGEMKLKKIEKIIQSMPLIKMLGGGAQLPAVKKLKRMPEVDTSIIVPAYNEEKVISDCINSLLALDHPQNKYEILVVNDGSTDKTTEIIRDFAAKYPNIILLSKENGGKASAQNLGLKHANGGFILITDADAVVERDWISEMHKDLEDFDLVLGSYFAKETNTWLERMQNALYLIKFKFGGLKGRPAIGVNNGFRREIVDKIGNFNESKTSITGDFIKRAEKAGLKIHYNPEIAVFTKCTKNIKGFVKQKLRWREDSLSYLKGEKITFSDISGLGYTVGLSFILFVSFFLSILLLNYQYFLFSFVGVFLISFLLYAKPFITMCNSEEKKYAKYFLGYILFEMIIRLMLIPYLAYRLIKPRKRPTFEAKRE